MVPVYSADKDLIFLSGLSFLLFCHVCFLKEETIDTRVGSTSQNGPGLINSAMDWFLLSVKRSQNSTPMACFELTSLISKEHTIRLTLKTQDDCQKHPDKKILSMRKVTPRDNIKNNKAQTKPRLSCSPQLLLRPLVALPFSLEVSSFSFSTFKVLELLLGFVVLFTVALLSTTCNGENILNQNWPSHIRWNDNNCAKRRIGHLWTFLFLHASSFSSCQAVVSSIF